MMKRFWNHCLLFIIVAFSEISQGFSQTFVAGQNTRSNGSLGSVAENLTDATGLFQGVLNGLFYVIGMVFIFGGFIRYYEHRKNPSQTPLGKVFFLLIAGIVIAFFPFTISYLGAKFAQAS